MDRIGIDAGGSLIKIAYWQNGEMDTQTFPVEKVDECVKMLQDVNPEAKVYLTGGKSAHVQSLLSGQTYLVDEFKATVKGARFLIEKENISATDYILASVGTGTSFFKVTPQSFERLFGSGAGGGTLMGLGSLLFNKNADFTSLVASAEKGDERASDLLIKDIYAPSAPPLTGDLTAANFGKAHLNKEATADDHMASLVRFLAETILLLALQAAQANQTKNLVFIGSTIEENQPLKQRLRMFEDGFDYKAIFIEKGAYAGAIGAMLE
ncbi:type II pantothenate kinase [Oceanobacillus kapialis]|uniref:Type II pantothenate kinase n=1 Tax=Oceanobacillus kapialis TaxID=481353 RepID=A0ABW5Q311_9BACI